MPCMDNDVLRRGKPTVHVKFGEAQAMLAGDAMQALAFEVLTPGATDAHGYAALLQARLCGLLARAAGHEGMAGGQAIDLASIGLPLNEAQLRDLHRIQQSQQHLLGLITTILDFARLESTKDIEVHLGPTVVHEILGEMEGFVGSQLEQRALSYGYHCCDERTVAFADPAKLQQIVLNLLANAIKFTPPGGHVSLECEEDAGSGSVVIKVIDSGIGIPADKLETVFQPFVQIRDKNSPGEGTGLGLSISRRLATAMGGMLTATSVKGNGSIFTLRLPLIKSDARRALPSG